MILVNILFLLLSGGYIAVSFLLSRDKGKELDKKEHRLYLFYPMAEDLLNRTELFRLLQRKREISTAISALYITNQPERLQRLYWYKKVSAIYLLLVIFSSLSLAWQLEASGHTILQEGKYLTRPEQGEGGYVAELTVDLVEQPEQGGEKAALSEDLSVTVKEREYTEKEAASILEDSAQYLRKAVLGKNTSPYSLQEPLNFITAIPGRTVTIEWKPENYELIHSDGSLGNTALTKAVPVSVIATISCQKQIKDLSLDFIVLPAVKVPSGKDSGKLEEEVLRASDQSSEQRRLELPTEWKHYRLHWADQKDYTGLQILLFGIVTAFLLWRMMDQELERRMKLRKEQMLVDYPEIINKFTLLVNAGMTIRQAWFRISEDYSIAKSDPTSGRSSTRRYAYEEMLTTVNELRLGVSETTAYEQYGRRTGLIPYIKFGSLITQNLKKGNRGFTEILKQEAMEAFEERKETAKRLGEEAGTKLLLPMMLMLLIVFMIILIPAFLSFRI